MSVRLRAVLVCTLTAVACAGPAPTPPEPAADGGPAPDAALTPAQPGDLYVLGSGMGRKLRRYELDEAELEEALRGIRDAALDRELAHPPDIGAMRQLDVFLGRRLAEVARSERSAGEAVLEAAASEPGAVVSESGLVVRELAPGDGPTPETMNYIRVHNHGTLHDGTVFESSRGREPRKLRLGQSLRCWQEALGAARQGARLHVVCPPHLGYGDRGKPPAVPGGAVLIYELELVEVLDP